LEKGGNFKVLDQSENWENKETALRLGVGSRWREFKKECLAVERRREGEKELLWFSGSLEEPSASTLYPAVWFEKRKRDEDFPACPL